MQIKTFVYYLLIYLALSGFVKYQRSEEKAQHIAGIYLTDGQFVGSAFFVEHKGKVRMISNAHVCNVGGNKVIYKTGTKHVGFAKPVRLKETQDLCELEFQAGPKTGFKIGSLRDLNLRDEDRSNDVVESLGFIRGELVQAEGGFEANHEVRMECDRDYYKSCKPGTILYFNAMKFTHPTYGGQSGSPLLLQGKVVGIMFARDLDTGMFIPHEEIEKFLN